MRFPQLRWLNTLGLALVLVLNYLANALPINGYTTGELSDMYPNLFVPAGFTFAIWGVIYLALLGFIIYQWVAPTAAGPVTNIGSLFFVSCVANATWILAWQYQQLPLSLLIMLLLFFTLLRIYQRLEIGQREPAGPAERWLARAPFSLYLGWITVATIANVTTLLVDVGYSGAPLGAANWAALVIAVAVIIGLLVLYRRHDWIYTAVLIWAFYGIYAKRSGLDDLPTVMLLVLAVGGGLLVIGALLKIAR
ncbi:MAG: hypothetical protein KDC54_17820, partial [Lewinella sp.]|nr:hypothetical protein [Lewinella sp.]